VTTSLLRLLIAGWILWLLVRAGRAAWVHRRLVRLVWSRIRPRHLVGSLGLLVLVGTVAVALLVYVPWTGYGLGSLVGLDGNAVFAPLEEAVARTQPAAPGARDWWLAGLATLFLGYLLVLLPWLAFLEEELFRSGLEDASPGREALAALRFGLAHLVMLVPLGAALAISVAGLAYSRAYRRAHRHAPGAPPPEAVARVLRPTRRSVAAARRARGRGAMAGVALPDGATVDRRPEHRQAAGVLASTVWHTTFNSLVVLLVWASVVVEALAP
jgi:hypothetical protein